MENNEEKNKQDVMVSNLPLLFSDGHPTSISSMSAEDLQYFIPFLLKCILGCEPPGWAKHPRFKWWTTDIPWSPIILTKKHQTPHWRGKLQSLVRNCYEYNGCTYLLHFSAKLQTLEGGYKFTDNWDGTTSMYDSKSGKLLVTFRNENMNYDKGFRQQCSASRPMLLPRLNSPNSPAKNAGTSNPSLALEAPTAAQMVEPPVDDIYLCDYCGADFSTLTAIKAHEAKCMADKALEAHSSNISMELETQDLDEAKFLWYLSLAGRNQTVPPANVTPAKVRPVVKKACTLSDKRFTTIPFSSNLGQSFFKATKLSPAASEFLVNRYERLCVAKPAVLPSTIPDNATCSNAQAYRLRPVFQRRKEEWAHTYSFSKADRRERMKTIATGLTKRARRLLRDCPIVRVTLSRVTAQEIEAWTRPKPKVLQPFLQPWLQRSIASLPPSCTISLAPVDATHWLKHHKLHTSELSITRNEKRITVPKQPQAREPPGLVPLITNAWSMQTMQSVKPRPPSKRPVLPDLIPVVNSPKQRSSNPVVIRMQSPKTRMPSQKEDVIDLCSSDDELDDEKGSVIRKGLSKPLILPPGISITKVKRTPNGVHSQSSPVEQNNNRSRNVSQWLQASNKMGSPPTLKFMGQQVPVKKEATTPGASTQIIHVDSSLPIVTPLKLGKLPPEKREQMKQSLLKIKKKEGISPSSGLGKDSPPTTPHIDLDMQASPVLPVGPSKTITTILVDECQQKALDTVLFTKEGLARRKRSKATGFNSCDEDDDSLSDAPSKKLLKLDHSPLQFSQEQHDDSDNYSTVIEVDVGGPDVERRDGSRASSFGSLTPDMYHKNKRELCQLLKDECKELRRKGLEDLPFDAQSNQRITRCRTRSLPLTANKR